MKMEAAPRVMMIVDLDHPTRIISLFVKREDESPKIAREKER